MKGYVAAKRSRYYAVIYEGLDTVTGREGRSWHPAGHDRADAEKLARRLAAQHTGRNDQTWSLNFGAYLTRQWLPGKRVVLAASTYAGYHRNVHRHILPNLGASGCGSCGPTTSTRSTTGSYTQPTVSGSPPRRCTRSTSSSAAR